MDRHKCFMSLTSLLVLFLVGCGILVQKENAARFKAMTIASVLECITVDDDDLEPFVLFHTRECFVVEHGTFRRIWNDHFITALKDRETQQTTYLVYSTIYSDAVLVPYQVNYKNANNSLVFVEGEKIASDRNCELNMGSRRCIHKEIFGFEIDNKTFQSLSENYESVKDKAFKFRIKTKAGVDVDSQFHPAEMVGLYRFVEDYWVN